MRSFGTEILKIWGIRTNARKIFLVGVVKFGYVAEWAGRCEILASSISILRRGHLSETLDEACAFPSGIFFATFGGLGLDTLPAVNTRLTAHLRYRGSQ